MTTFLHVLSASRRRRQSVVPSTAQQANVRTTFTGGHQRTRREPASGHAPGLSRIRRL